MRRRATSPHLLSRLVGALLLLGLPAAASAQTCTTSWTNAAGGAWTNAANWDAGVPDANDDACIVLDGTYTVTVNTFSVNSLTLGDGDNTGVQTLVNSGNISLGTTGSIGASGVFEWRNGYVTAGTLTNNGLVVLTGSGGARGVNTNGAIFRNEATVTWTDGAPFYLYNNGARAENAGLWDSQSTGDLLGFGGVSNGGSTFVNESGATFQKTTDGTTNVLSITVTQFENEGTVDAQAGTIQFNGNSTHTNPILTASAGATIDFNSGTPTFVGTTTGSPAGTIQVGVNFVASTDATWDFDGTGLTWQDGYLTAGALTNDGLVALTGSGGSRGVNNNNALFRNEATVTWTDGAPFYLYNNGARAENAGLWESQSIGDLLGFGGVTNGGSVFVNENGATFKKTGDASGNPLLITVNSFDNAGIVSPESGTIDLNVNTDFDHQIGGLIQGTSTFDIAGATFTHNGDTGPGTSPGTLSWIGPWAPSAAATFFVEIAGNGGPGAANGHDQLAVNGNATLSGALDVSLLGGFKPSEGDQYVILTASSVTGQFNNTVAGNRIYAGNGVAFTVIYNPTNVTLVADLLQADYALAKLVDGVASKTVDAGTDVTFTVTITNNGPDDGSEFGLDAEIEVEDQLPAGLTLVSSSTTAGTYDPNTGLWMLDALDSGDSETLTIVATVAQGTHVNTATINTTALENTNGSNDSASAQVEGQSADLAVTKSSSPNTVMVGDAFTYEVTLTNNGPNAATAIAVADTIPAGLTCTVLPSAGTYSNSQWTVPSLANGGSATLLFGCTASAAGTYQNTATRTASSPVDANAGNDSASASVVVTASPDQADLQLAKTVSAPTATVGTQVTFVVTLTNSGPDAATGIAVSDPQPAGLTFDTVTPSAGSYSAGVWTVASLASGADETLTIVATVTQAGQRTNTATITASDQIDPDATNNEASASVTGQPAGPSAQIVPSLDSLAAQCDGTYTAFFGYQNANSVVVNIPVGPSNFFAPAPQDRGQTTAFQPGTQQQAFSVSFAGGTITWTLTGPDGQTRTATANSSSAPPAQGCTCQSPVAPSYAGGYVLNSAGTRAFVQVTVPEGGTRFRFYNTTNLVVGNPEGDTESGTPLTGFTRAGDVFDFSPPSPTEVFFPVTTAGGGTRVAFFLAITDACGQTVDVDPDFTITGVFDDGLEGFMLAPAAPSPTTGPALIRFSLSAPSDVQLAVYDVLGREVARLVDAPLAAGTHQARFDATALPAGVYVYRLYAEGQTRTRTLTVAR